MTAPVPSPPSDRSGASAPRIVDVVFARTPREAWVGAAALLLTCTLHALVWLWAQSSQPSLESWSAELAAHVHAELRREEAIELPKPKPPEPPPPPPPEPPKAPAPRPQPARSSPVAKAPPPPAQAGRIIAQESKADSLDLTANTFVTGLADAYAGGTTTSSGTNTKAVFTQTVAPEPSREPDRSRPVSLAENEWQCAWPRAADAEDIDEKSVVVRVWVRPDGSVESARLLADPGHGFGEAALACAARTHFTPARNRQGQALRAESPPIRVRFTR